jgi:hypothetical protein
MLKKKERKPALEINLNLVPLLESLGMSEAMDQVIKTIQKGKTEVLDRLLAKAQQGQVKVEVSVGGRKKKVPINFVVRLKKE